jgi:hypothetical protein
VPQILGDFRVGEDVVVAFAPTTTPSSLISILAASIVGTTNGVVVSNAGALPMTITPMAAQGTTPAGWYFTLPAAQSAGLTPGTYAIDAKFLIAGSTSKTGTSAFVSLSLAAV